MNSGRTPGFMLSEDVRQEVLTSIQIMNVYECNGTKYFHEVTDEMSIQRGEAELNGNFICHRIQIFS